MAFVRNKLATSPAVFPHVRNKHPRGTYGPTLTGYLALPQTLTINSVTHNPLLFVTGNNATPTGWTATAGQNLNVAGSGTEIVANSSGPYGVGPKFGPGKYYTTTDGTAVRPDSVDWVCEFVYKHAWQAGINREFLYQWGGNQGYWVYAVADRLAMIFRNAAVSTTVVTTNQVFTIGEVYHVMLFIDRDENSTNGGLVYANGALVGQADFSATTGVVPNNSTQLTVPSASGTNGSNSEIYQVGMWRAAGLMPGGSSNPTQAGAVAAARFALLTA